MDKSLDLERTPIKTLLVKLAPPVMFALLVQAVYNIVDSIFVARYASAGLTALAIIYPIQTLMSAVASGTGSGANILVSRLDGQGEKRLQNDVVRSGLWLAVFNYLVFAVVGFAGAGAYFAVSSSQEAVRELGVQYAQIIFVGGLGMFGDGICSRFLQARGNVVTPVIGSTVGVITNIVLDPVLIFGLGPVPELGLAGAALATCIAQWCTMAVTFRGVVREYPEPGHLRIRLCAQIYSEGAPAIFMLALSAIYIIGLNQILKGFTEDAVTVLGIYYKLQSFFFIPLTGLQQVMLPILSFNHGAGHEDRVRQTLRLATRFSFAVMAMAAVAFWLVPGALVGIFSTEESVVALGKPALRIIATSFLPCAPSLMYNTYFQGVGRGRASLFVTVLRQVILLVPLAWALGHWGLTAVWLAFPLTEIITMVACLILNDPNRVSFLGHSNESVPHASYSADTNAEKIRRLGSSTR